MANNGEKRVTDPPGTGREIGSLLEFRENHKQEHEKHVATQAWVYKTLIAGALTTLGLAVGIATLIARFII